MTHAAFTRGMSRHPVVYANLGLTGRPFPLSHRSSLGGTAYRALHRYLTPWNSLPFVASAASEAHVRTSAAALSIILKARQRTKSVDGRRSCASRQCGGHSLSATPLVVFQGTTTDNRRFTRRARCDSPATSSGFVGFVTKPQFVETGLERTLHGCLLSI